MQQHTHHFVGGGELVAGVDEMEDSGQWVPHRQVALEEGPPRVLRALVGLVKARRRGEGDEEGGGKRKGERSGVADGADEK